MLAIYAYKQPFPVPAGSLAEDAAINTNNPGNL